ncbi:hypothetical protein QYE76_028633 [Lolium multiflorum]|uniref:Integrase catalytic domain-containing protein n=1 Tax=Lolium multiflorum TaxID=4521 RepID=A0AAD8QMA8_LOLMU|nr:hypothetical protein QYE76_028633 [Lolium multiflorum]
MLASSHNIFEVIGDDLLFVVVVGYPPIVVFKAVNVVLPPPPINLPMEEFGIGVALPYVGDPRALPLTSPLNNRKAHHFPLKVRWHALAPASTCVPEHCGPLPEGPGPTSSPGSLPALRVARRCSPVCFARQHILARPVGHSSTSTASTSASEMAEDPVTYEDLIEEHKKKYNELKALFEADLIGSFERTRTHGIRWKGFSAEGALDEVDLSTASEERTRALRQEVNYMVAHSLHRHSESLVNAFERVAPRGPGNHEASYSPSGPTLGTHQGEIPFHTRPQLTFSLAAPEPPGSPAFVVYKIGGDTADYQFMLEPPKEIPDGYTCMYVPDCNNLARTNQITAGGISGTAGGISGVDADKQAWLAKYATATDQQSSAPAANSVDQISAILRDQFGMVPKRRAIGYSKPYPNEYDLIPLPPKYRLPEFSKFSEPIFGTVGHDLSIRPATHYFTKWVEAVPMKSVKSEDVINFVKEHVIHRFGIPQTITTDGGSVFISKEFRKFCDDMGIKLIRSSPYYAQANGQAEVSNQSLIKLIKRKVDEHPRRWHENDLTTEEYAAMMSDSIEDLTELRLWSLEKIKENKAKVARAYNKKVRPKEFQIGDLVWEVVLPLGTKDKAYGKWSPNWHGPYRVDQVLKGNAYMLEQLDGVKFPVAVNGQHLKKYFPSMWDDGQ